MFIKCKRFQLCPHVYNLSNARLREGEVVRRHADRGLQGGRVADGGVHAADLRGAGGHGLERSLKCDLRL